MSRRKKQVKISRKKSAVKPRRPKQKSKASSPAPRRRHKTLATSISETKKILETDIGRLEGRRISAGKKSDKKKIGKQIAAKKSLYRKLSN